jgi:hypothetical protein
VKWFYLIIYCLLIDFMKSVECKKRSVCDDDRNLNSLILLYYILKVASHLGAFIFLVFCSFDGVLEK